MGSHRLPVDLEHIVQGVIYTPRNTRDRSITRSLQPTSFGGETRHPPADLVSYLAVRILRGSFYALSLAGGDVVARRSER